jgi:ethylbenzene dioxygenase beta subunit
MSVIEKPKTMRGVEIADGARVDLATHHEVSQFLFTEVRLLAEEQFEDWLALFTEDAHYWMPGIENRYRRDKRGSYDLNDMAYFDDTKEGLALRVKRLLSGQAWPEDPATRHVMSISNVEVFEASEPDHLVVYSHFISYRNKGERDDSTLHGRRRDVLRKDGASFKIAKRRIVISQAILLSKNLNVFF